MPTLDLLFGPIASGKSTYATTQAKGGTLIVNDDAIVMAVHGGDYKSYRKNLRPLYKMIGLQIIHSAAAMDRDVIIDSTNLKRSTRMRHVALGRSLGFRPRLVCFRGGKFLGAQDGDRRYEADPRGLSLSAWRKVGEEHVRQMESVDRRQEGYDDVFQIPWK